MSKLQSLKKSFTTGMIVLSLSLSMVLAASVVIADSKAPDYVKLIEQVSPAVVNISTTTQPRRSSQQPPMMPFPEGWPFGEMFRYFFGEIPPQTPQRPQGRPVRSLGSGFIISPDGYILTNAHVVDGADTITVRMSDRTEFTAELVGQDDRTDVALLKIEASNLPHVKIGKSSEVRVGEWVLAIGSPFGLEHTATHGIVSAIGRNLPNENYVPFIQTDAPVNPGNSGGPLFNAKGEVIGINSQIYTRSGGYMGLSFAIPIDVAMNVVEQLRSTGKVTRGYLGVYLQPVTADLARSFGLDKPRGALVAQVQPDEPADKAGIKPGDIILEFDGHVIEQFHQLPLLVGQTPVGKTVQIKVLRDGKEQTLTASIGQLDDVVATTEKISTLGLTLKPLTDRQKAELNVSYGLLVEAVSEGVAARAGVRPNDILLEVNNQPMTSKDDLRAAIRAADKTRPLAVRLLRNGQPMFLAIKLN